MKRVCVFCGSRRGQDERFSEAARQLGAQLAGRGYTLVYGGSSLGLMGVLADTVLQHGGEVIGVIPEALAGKEIAHAGLSELRVVDSMHTRKATMAELADGFIAMPGGMGTLEEFCEIVTWAQLGFHTKPIGLLNVAAFYSHLVGFIDTAVAQGFIGPEHRELILVDTQPGPLLESFALYEPGIRTSWVEEDDL